MMFREPDIHPSDDGGFWVFAQPDDDDYPNPDSYDTLLETAGMDAFFTNAPATGTHYFAIAHVHMVDDVPQTAIVPVLDMTLEYPSIRQRRRR